MLKGILKLFFPPRCIFCRKIVENVYFSVCPECVSEIPKNNKQMCRICSTPLNYTYGDMVCKNCRKTKRFFKRIYAPLIYDKQVRRSMIGFKFYGHRAYARTLATYMYILVRRENIKPDVITYVPIHFIRLGMRGYNQSQLLANYLGKLMNVPVVPYLKRTKYTRALSNTKHKQRKEIVKGTFGIRHFARGLNVLLVDDIVTTCSTINECAKILLEAGASCVEGIAAAVTPHEI